MITTNTSVCIECGKQRIVTGTHTEKVGTSTISYKETACPDPECQKRVDLTLLRELEKRQESMKTNRFRLAARRTVKVNKKVAVA
ncbi:MAG: hypothetical protein ACHQUA_02460 [Microgenomates group bacterium]